uniref:3-hydroxyisobutyrate dehydrogenase n=1 Tax=Cyprinus carpio carpio TaxID=630221 RepID=A0A9J8D6B9_CYPCA
MASKTPVGFIGLGNMGTPMARNLLKHGYPVIATDVFPESCKEFQDSGAQILDCPAEVADKADRIITMLPSSPNVIEVYTGPNGILKLGLDPKLLAKILNMSSGRCWSSDKYNPVPGVMEGVPSANNYQGGFGTKLMAKDLGFAQNTATSTRTPIPLGSLAHQIYRTMCAHGYSNKDFSSVFQFLREEEVQ